MQFEIGVLSGKPKPEMARQSEPKTMIIIVRGRA